VKPLPLLLALCVLALAGGVFLIIGTGNSSQSSTEDLVPAPLPPSFEEEEEAFAAEPEPPLLENEFVPNHYLLEPVESFLSQEFESPPVFQPVSSDELIQFISEDLAKDFPDESQERLTVLAEALGIAPTYQPLPQSLITLLAGEVRGYVSPQKNLIIDNFHGERPPEQAALVNLLTRRLLQQTFPAPSLNSADVDEILGHQLLLQTFAFLAEKEFRKSLPSYPPSLEENIRESILLGLPSFFHELANFSEFHLAERISQPDPQTALERLTEAHSEGLPLTRSLLAYPDLETVPPAELSFELGPISLYLPLLEATEIPEARTLALALRRDSLQHGDGSTTWTMTFNDASHSARAATLLKNVFALRKTDIPPVISHEENRLIIKTLFSHE
jgi:hypothetical protein